MNIKDIRNVLVEFLGTFLIVMFSVFSLAGFYHEKINLLSLGLINTFITAVVSWGGIIYC